MLGRAGHSLSAIATTSPFASAPSAPLAPTTPLSFGSSPRALLPSVFAFAPSSAFRLSGHDVISVVPLSFMMYTTPSCVCRQRGSPCFPGLASSFLPSLTAICAASCSSRVSSSTGAFSGRSRPLDLERSAPAAALLLPPPPPPPPPLCFAAESPEVFWSDGGALMPRAPDSWGR